MEFLCEGILQTTFVIRNAKVVRQEEKLQKFHFWFKIEDNCCCPDMGFWPLLPELSVPLVFNVLIPKKYTTAALSMAIKKNE